MQAKTLVVTNSSQEQGFTLIEMLMAIVILAIALTIGVPSMSKQIEKSRQNGLSTGLQQTVRLATTQALAKSRNVVLCPSANGESCSSSSWDSGYIVFVDNNGDKAVDNDDDILRHESTNGLQVEIDGGAGDNKFLFRANGTASGGTIKICSDSVADIDQQVEISGFGSTTVKKDLTDACGGDDS